MLDFEKIKKFVYDRTADRDSSHGYEHMEKVYKNAMTIYAMITKGKTVINILNWITIVAWLYDVANPKYDKDGELRKHVQSFIQFVDENHAKELMDCIDCVSFSREKKEGKEYYKNILSLDFVLVRNVVSDADKLEALGVTGLERCEKYIWHTATEAGEYLSTEELMTRILIHCKEKLFILSSEYMRTIPGHKMAMELDKEMMEWLERK
jgi:hypothetical protein